MKKSLLLWLITFSILSCNSNQSENTFILEAKLKGIEDGATVYLIDKASKILDSAKVNEEKTVITGKIDEPTNVIFVVKETNDRKFIWIEPGKSVTLEATSGSFLEASLLGSENYNKSKELRAREQSYEDRMDEINDYALKNLENLTRVQIDSLKKLYEVEELKSENESQVFIAEYPNSFYSIYLLDFYKTTYGKDITKKLFLNIDASLKETSHAKSILKYLEINRELQIGDLYIDVTLKNINGEPKSISDVKGKYTLIEFWGSRCGPCRLTNPKLVKIYQKYQPKGFEIYGISLDIKKEEWLAAVRKDGLLWENVVDLNGNDADVALQYGVSALPHNFLIDEQGKIIALDMWSEDLEKKLETLLP